ncbi:MAG TPA: MFS transporter [Bacillota bacterium]|nr:MFS transporter [Bacillota bacterium]HOL08808.1 MFS transporter [Bacillota bacterium]HPO96898.1 MFS transporter [Bacillota bacterium]
MNNKLQTTLIIIGSFFIFFMFGFLDNLRGPLIPEIIKDLNLRYSLIGNMLFMQYIGFLAATIGTGFLSYKFGLKPILTIALALLFAGIALIAGIPQYFILIITFLILGLGLGLLEIACHNIIILSISQKIGMFLNLLGVCYGIGSMLAPLYAGSLLSNGISWQNIYAICLLPIGILLLYHILIRFPKFDQKQEPSILSLITTAFSSEMFWHYLGLCSYTAAEIGIAVWIVEYLNEIKGYNLFYSSLALSVYFGLITVGRLIGSFFVDRIGHLKMLLLVSVSAIFSITIGIYGPTQLAFLLPFTGFFFAIIFPTITASFTNIKKPNIQNYLGFLFTFSGIGGMIGPWLIGVLGDRYQLANSMAVLILYLMILVITVGILFFLERKTNAKNN